MKGVFSRIKTKSLGSITGLVLSVLVLLSTGCASHVAGQVLRSPNKTLTSAPLTINNTTMFKLTYVIVKDVKGAPFYMSKNLKYFGELSGYKVHTIDDVPNGRYILVYKIGYIDDVLYFPFLVMAEEVLLEVRDTNKKFEVGG
jgi:hypothetical protein